MTRLFSFLAFLSLVLPLLLLIWHALFSKRATRARMALLTCAVCVLSLFFLHPHEDIYTGVDNSAYRLMAEAFADGRPLLGTDATALSVPAGIRPLFQYRQPGGGLRPTRDMLFQYEASTAEDRPFFMPFLPLAAAAIGRVEYFPVALGVLWLILLFGAASRHNGKHGLAMATALLLATPWFFWFTRGFFPDAAGALIASSVLLHSLCVREESLLSAICSGFLLGLAVTVHPTSVLLAAPIFVFCAVRNPRPRLLLAASLASLAGLAPFWAITRHVCHPYGDWTRLTSLIALFKAAPEHRILIIGAVFMALLVLLTVILACTRNGNALLHRLLGRVPPFLWFTAAIAPILALLLLPSPFADAMRRETVAIWTGFRASGFLLWILAALLVLTRVRSKSVSALFVLAFWLFIPFMLIKGAEVPVGIWSLRRAAPPVLLLTALLAPLCPFPSFPSLNTHRRKQLLAVGIAVLALLNVFRWPAAYFAVNGRNAAAIRSAVRETVSPFNIVVFDYYPHFVPVSPSHDIRTLGVGTFARDYWPQIEQWLLTEATTSRLVTVVSAYAPASLEENCRLELLSSDETSGTIRNIVSKNFLPVIPDERKIVNNVLRVVPLNGDATNLTQEKRLDGGPIGLRGEWHFPRNKGIGWTRQGSGIVGPVHEGEIEVQIEAEWPESHVPAPTQQMLLTPPWSKDGIPFSVTAGKTNIVLRLEKTTALSSRPTGIYTFSSPTPYNPLDFGVKGHPDDLGVIIRSVRIR